MSRNKTTLDMSKLFDTAYRNILHQLDRHGVTNGNREQACVSASMDILLATMRQMDTYKKMKVQNNTKGCQTEAMEQEKTKIDRGTQMRSGENAEMAIYVSDDDE